MQLYVDVHLLWYIGRYNIGSITTQRLRTSGNSVSFKTPLLLGHLCVCVIGKSLDIYMFYDKLIKIIWINRQKISEELILISIATLKELKIFVFKNELQNFTNGLLSFLRE